MEGTTIVWLRCRTTTYLRKQRRVSRAPPTSHSLAACLPVSFFSFFFLFFSLLQLGSAQLDSGRLELSQCSW